MKKTSKRLLALLCAVLMLPLLVQPVAVAESYAGWTLVETYDHWTKYCKLPAQKQLYTSPIAWSEHYYGPVEPHQSMMMMSLWQSDSNPDIKLYKVLYFDLAASRDAYLFVPVPSVEVQNEPYPWSWAQYGRKDLYAIKEDSTPCYLSPWKSPYNIKNWLNRGHLFRVYTSGTNTYENISWLRVSDMNAFVEEHEAVYVGPILETSNELKTPLPMFFAPGETVDYEGYFHTNWKIKKAAIKVTVGGNTYYEDEKTELPPGTYAYKDFFDPNKVSSWPVNDVSSYILDITVTVVAPNWPWPEKTIPVVERMGFLIYQPATRAYFERAPVTIGPPGKTFDNPVLVEPEETSYKSNYELKVENPSILEDVSGHTARFTALREGSTRVFVTMKKPDGSLDKVEAYFWLRVVPYDADTTVDGLHYRIDGGDATIIQYSTNRDFWLVIVPDKVEGVPVTRIGERAFDNVSDVTDIVLPDSIASIGKGAFVSCGQLESIFIPAGVTSIEECTFQRCKSLSSVTLPEGLTRIGDAAFDGCCNLPSITIPASVTSIGDWAFIGCSGLASITIPAGVTSIGNGAFYDCSGLTSITIPAGVTSIGESAFANCSSLMSITIPKSVTSIGDSVFKNTPVAIHGYLNSKAHQYATDNGIPFKPLDAPAPLPGDANGDGNLDIVDLVSIIDFIVNGTHCPSMENADANGDKIIDIVDLVWIINKLVGI